jgi:hypothetical protein
MCAGSFFAKITTNMVYGYVDAHNTFGIKHGTVLHGGKRINVIALMKHVQSERESDEATLDHLVAAREGSTLAEWTVALEATDRATHTLFTMACAQGKVQCVQYLLAENPEPQLQYVQRNGHNGLSAAIWNGHYELALLLSQTYHMHIPSKMVKNKEFAMHREVWQQFLASNES